MNLDPVQHSVHLTAFGVGMRTIIPLRGGIFAGNSSAKRSGDIDPLGTLPLYRRQGLLCVAILEDLRRMKACVMNHVCIYTGVSNIPAKRLYESIGLKIANQYLD